ncbi:pentatricopeptide repeat-containing protein At3g22690-like [Lotus japonicus]|uniref:pentatricopeptide repeat-containing protein At3g22690-like n=1 Tax=Lotus japonicus TaxID=34305 RepID=UPI00258D7BAC|nr:pentatricopeptide repeat-containing protein At3g22690-like [Lotus japonicus]
MVVDGVTEVSRRNQSINHRSRRSLFLSSSCSPSRLFFTHWACALQLSIWAFFALFIRSYVVPIFLGTFLAACRKHKNVELAHYAAEKLTQLAPERVGIHMLLSNNMYASAGKWTDVARVRLQMKEKGVQKVPGSSSIEVQGLIHEFAFGDESHAENTQIELMLQEINCRLNQAGFVPDTTNVLVDVDEREKEHLLARHSEKLAMAYGLIITAQGIPIRVVKNLRMCSDCHSFAKLVSKLYHREITMRDNNRYHFFKEGSCSCRDFW